jgi:O-acetyl-ADP-ribose deacetylase (regulator of RNase III)
VWHGGKSGEAELLTSAYKNSLLLAEKVGARSVAFPAISTGVYGYPQHEAASVAVNTVANFLKDKAVFDRIIFACFDEKSAAEHRKALELIHHR